MKGLMKDKRGMDMPDAPQTMGEFFKLFIFVLLGAIILIAILMLLGGAIEGEFNETASSFLSFFTSLSSSTWIYIMAGIILFVALGIFLKRRTTDEKSFSGSKGIWIVLAIVLVVMFLGSSCFVGRFASESGQESFLAQIGQGFCGDLTDAPSVPSAFAHMTLGELFEPGENGGSSVFSGLLKQREFGIIAEIFANKLSGPLESLGGGILSFLGYKSLWNHVGKFIYLLIVGFISAFIASFFIGWMALRGYLGESFENFWDSENEERGYGRGLNYFLSGIFAFAYAVLFSIPLLSRILELITFATLTMILPQPIEFIFRILILAFILCVVVFVPGIIRWRMDNKKKQSEISGISDTALGAATLQTIGRQSRRSQESKKGFWSSILGG
jgi:hypothetical protein